MIIGVNADEYRDRKATAEDYLCPSQVVASTRNDTGASAWMYYFTRVRQDAAGAELGAYHGAEYPYSFGTHDSYMTTTEYDLELSALIQRYWINFAANGDPNGEGFPKWPLFYEPDAKLLELGDEVRVIPAVEPESCAAFKRLREAPGD